VRGVGRIKRFVRRRLPALLPGVPILIYHRVTEVAADPWALCVTPAHFAEHLQVLRQRHRPIPLGLLAGSSRALLACAVAVTFDDGYADNLLNAKPLLDRYEVPATAFVPTGRLEVDREFWWDELERVLLQPGRLPRSLHLTISDRAHDWDLGEATDYTADQAKRYSTWRAWEHPPTGRHALYRHLYDLLHLVEPAEQGTVVAKLRDWAGVAGGARQTHRSLTIEEVQSLDRSDLIEIGAHTVSHPNLAALPLEVQIREIQQSKAYLEAIVGHPVAGFAYAFGRRCDYTEQTVAQVRASGFSHACSNFGGLATPATDRFQLPRMQVQDWHGAEFAEHLNRWFGW
jgi:peptidoglycan/xylan/chitin deacetylase (PgdA/CDA1 family)